MQDVKNWRKVGEWLFAPERKDGDWIYSILDEIQRQCATNEDRLRGMIDHWLMGEGHPPSWRRLIYSLDRAEELAVADPIRGFAEPPPGESS